MGVDMKVKAIYDSEIGNITRSEKNWKDVLKVAGQLYRYEFDNIVMVTAQRPPEKAHSWRIMIPGKGGKICKAWCERLRYLPVKGTESTHEVYI